MVSLVRLYFFCYFLLFFFKIINTDANFILFFKFFFFDNVLQSYFACVLKGLKDQSGDHLY